MSCIRIESNPSGTATLWLDAPRENLNRFSRQRWSDLSGAIGELAAAKPARVIFASPLPGIFALDGDAQVLCEMNDLQLDDYLHEGQQVLQELRTMSTMTVAAINGDCLGAGLELAMACRIRVCADDSSIRLGLPETTFGLVPARGGTFLMRGLVGLEEAVMLVAEGEALSPQDAMRIGLVDRICPFEELMQVAAQINGQQQKKSNAMDPRRIIEWADGQIRKKFSGDETIAPLKVLQIMRNGMMHGEARELSDARQAILELRHLPTTQKRIEALCNRQAMEKREAAAPR